MMKMKTNPILTFCISALLLLPILPVYAQQNLTLEVAIQKLMKNNFDILVAGKQVEITKVQNTLGNAGMLPTIALTGTGSFAQNAVNQKLSSGAETNFPAVRSTDLSAGAQLNWTLFDGGKMFVTKRKLNEIQSLGELQFKEKVLQAMYQLIAAYYDVVRYKQQLASIQEAQNLSREQVKITQAGFNAGSLVKTDLLQAQIDFNIATQSIITQQFVIDASLKNLNVILGESQAVNYDITDSIPLNFIPNATDLLQKINNSNISLLALQQQMSIAKLALKENNSAYLPTFNVKAGYYASVSDNSVGGTLHNSTLGPQIGGTLSIPIYNAGETRRKTAIANIQAETAKYDMESLKLQLNTELQVLLKEYENQQQLLKIEGENNLLAKENITISLERLKQGQTTSLEVHQAQEYYVQSSTRLINFRYNLKMAETRLKQMGNDLLTSN